MKIVAISVKGAEYLYNLTSAHTVSARGAARICEILNRAKYRLKEGQVWHVHDVDSYDSAYIYAKDQKFYIRKGCLKRAADMWAGWPMGY